SSDLSNSLRDWIGHREKLVGVFVGEQMVIAKVRTTHVPVEIFGFHVEREHLSQNGVHRSSDVPGRRTCEIGPRFQWRFTSVQKFYGLSRISFLHSLICSG